MVRILQALTVLVLISAGVVFVLCAGQWLQGASASEQIEQNLGPPVLERFRRPAKGGDTSGKETLSALALHHCGTGLALHQYGTGLVRQAEAFALYLNPPERPKGEKATAPKRISKQTVPAAIAAKVTPKFTLVGTSYYRSRPEESMALVSEPGWDFVAESVNDTEDIWWILEGQDYPRLWWELIEEGSTALAENWLVSGNDYKNCINRIKAR